MTESLGLTLDWQSPNQGQHPTLHADEYHLWWLPLSLNAEQESHAYQLLNEVQRDKYHRRAPELQQSYLAGRYFLLTLLGHYTSTPASEVLLSYNHFNKPYLSNNSTIQFNFSDTKVNGITHGVFAFCHTHAIGIDLESRSRDIDFAPIAKRRFTQQELDYITQTDGQIDTERCLAIWTRKEAFGKASGTGINFKMNEVNLIDAHSFELNVKIDSMPWRLQQIQFSDDLIGCVVHEQHQTLEIKAFNSLNHIP